MEDRDRMAFIAVLTASYGTLHPTALQVFHLARPVQIQLAQNGGTLMKSVFVVTMSLLLVTACGVSGRDLPTSGGGADLASSPSGKTVLSGYFAEVARDSSLTFVAIDEKNQKVVAMLPDSVFTDEVFKKMADCFREKRQTHKITIEEHPNEIEDLPTDIPGMTGTSHFPVYKNPKCVKAPGFYQTWQQVVRSMARR